MNICLNLKLKKDDKKKKQRFFKVKTYFSNFNDVKFLS